MQNHIFNYLLCNNHRFTGTWKNNRENKKVRVTSIGKDVRKLESSYTAGRKVKWCSHLRKQSGSSSNEMPYDPAVLLLGIYA